MSTFGGPVEKKNGMFWNKKFASLEGMTLTISDTQGGPAVLKAELGGVFRNDDPTVLAFSPEGGGEMIVLRVADASSADNWYDVTYEALENAKKVPLRNCGLPPLDPRFNLRFIDIPPQYMRDFAKLEPAVLYFFAPIRKYGAASKLTRKHKLEERVCFVSDKFLYVTKPDSEVTRCLRIQQMKAIHTNAKIERGPKEETFVVIKMDPPEYDLYFAHPDCDKLVDILSILFKYLSRGVETLPVVDTIHADSIELRLSKPPEYSFSIVVPTTKERLKMALEKFAADHGATLSALRCKPSEAAAPSSRPGNEKPAAAAPPTQSRAAESHAAAPEALAPSGSFSTIPDTDPLGVLLVSMGMGQYWAPLRRQSIDLDVMECMEKEDLKHFGFTPEDAEVVAAKIADPQALEDARDRAREAQCGWKEPTVPSSTAPKKEEAPKETAKPQKSDQPVAKPAPSQPPQQASPPLKAAPPIVLDDDDDLGILPSAGANKPAPFKVSLDSDDDLDLPPVKPQSHAPAAPPINLDEDIQPSVPFWFTLKDAN